jgi:hypothetical protein
MIWCGSAVFYFFSIDRNREGVRLRRGLPLVPMISFCGLGGVFSARRIASSRRRAVSSALYSSRGFVIEACHQDKT